MKLHPAALIIILLSYNAQAAGVSLSPQSQNVVAGNNFTISVVLDPQGSNIYGAQFSLTFDKTIIEAVSMDKGALLGSDGAATIEGAKTIDNTGGKVTYSLSRSGTNTGINSSGTLAGVTFRGLKAGVTALNFETVILSDPNATEIPGSTNGGSVTVSEAAAPTATHTVIQTATPAPAITGASSSSAGSNGAATPSVIENNTLELAYPDNTVVTLSPVGSVREGDEFAVNVYIKPAEPVYGAELKLLFDNKHLEGVGIEQGTFLGGSPVVNSVDNEKGEMSYAETRVGNVTGVRAKGILAKATFRAKIAGNTTIGLKDIKMVNENEAVISGVLSDSISLNILKRAEDSYKGDAVGVYWVLIALVSLVFIMRRRAGG